MAVATISAGLIAAPDRSAQTLWNPARITKIHSVILVALIWTAVGLFQVVPDMFNGIRWTEVVGKFLEAWTWALLSPAILLIDRKLSGEDQNVSRRNIIRLIGAHLLLSIPFSLIHTYLTGLLMYPFAAITWNPLRNAQYAIYFYLGGWMTYCALVSVLQAFKFYLQAFKFYNRFLTSQVELERVEKRLIQSRLNALRLQLEPHFLFNTLNSISSELDTEPRLARDMIEDLGALLRQSLECQDSNEIPLAQELALLNRYLAIQKLRFGDRLDIKVDVEPSALSVPVPSMLLQPLVENAIRHGIEIRMSGGTIVVRAKQVGRHLKIDIIDDGVGLPSGWHMETSAGRGLRVTRERLEALYSNCAGHGFTVSRRKEGGTKVAVKIPRWRNGAESCAAGD